MLTKTSLSACTQACQKYDAACSLQSGSHACAYNWGVALSDLAKHHRASEELLEAEAKLIESAQMYAASLKWNPNHPQVCSMPSSTVLTSFKATLQMMPAEVRGRACVSGPVYILRDKPTLEASLFAKVCCSYPKLCILKTKCRLIHWGVGLGCLGTQQLGTGAARIGVIPTIGRARCYRCSFSLQIPTSNQAPPRIRPSMLQSGHRAVFTRNCAQGAVPTSYIALQIMCCSRLATYVNYPRHSFERKRAPCDS